METTEKTTEQMEEEITQALVPMQAGALSVIEQAGALTISDNVTLEQSVSIEKELKKQDKAYLDLFKPFKQALDVRKKNALDKEKERRTPIQEAIDSVKEKRNEYVRAENTRLVEEAEKREAEERRKRAAALAKYNESIKKAMEKTGDLAEQVVMLKEQLDSPDTPEEAREGLRGQIRGIEAQIATQNRLVAEKAAQAEAVATAPAPAPAASVAPKPKGLVQKEYYTVQVKEPRRLCQAIADGHIRPDIIKGYDTIALQALAKYTDLEKYGCQVDVETRTHTRG